MISVTNLTTQTLQPGQSLTFDNIVMRSNRCSAAFRSGSSAIRTGVGLFRVDFNEM